MINPTIEYMATQVLKWLRDLPPEVEEEFRNVPFDKLIQYHHTLGREVRNHFSLWACEWVPDIQEGVDCSPNHPDSISMQVIEKVWANIQ